MANVTLPVASQPLFEPSRVKVVYGGCGGGKTQMMARSLLVRAAQQPLFIVCVLENQATLEDTAMRLISSLVEEFGLDEMFVKSKMSVTGINRSEITFEQISRCGRMFEHADIVWVEDGHDVSYRSWNIILTRTRKRDSEVWVSMNPGLGNGEAYRRFFEEKLYSPVLIETNHRTNPHFPESMEIERQRMLREDPEEYQHLWEGVPVCSSATPESLTVVGDDGTVEEIASDSPMAVLKRISLDKSESVASRIEAARSLLPYVHKKQPVAIEGLGHAAGVAGVLTPENLKNLSDADIESMLAVLQGGKPPMAMSVIARDIIDVEAS